MVVVLTLLKLKVTRANLESLLETKVKPLKLVLWEKWYVQTKAWMSPLLTQVQTTLDTCDEKGKQ